MAQKAKAKLNGILIQDPRATVDALWSAESSYTQASPVAGIPETYTGTDPSRLRLIASGQGRTFDTEVRCVQSGTGLSDSGRLAWRNDTSESYRGLEPPITVASWEPIEWDSGEQLQEMGALATKDDTQLCAYRRKAGTKWDLEVARIARDGTTTQIVVKQSLYDDHIYPCMVQLPDGRIHLYFWYYEQRRTRWTIRGYTSSDDGASWDLLNDSVLKDQWTSTLGTYTGTVNRETAGIGVSGYSSIGRLTACYLNGSVCLFGALTLADTSLNNRKVLRQWASVDMGCTFELVESDSTATTVADNRQLRPVLLSAGREAYLLYVGRGYDICWKILTSAWQPSSEVDESTLAVAAGDVGELTACIDDTGTVWIYPMHDSASAGKNCRGPVYSSTDRMRTVIPHGVSGYQTYWFDGLDSTANDGELKDVSACFARGQASVFCRHEWSGATYTDTLSVFHLGGWSSVQLPGFYPAVKNVQTRTAYQGQYFPGMELPDSDSRFTATGAGSAAVNVNGELQIDATAGQRLYYEIATNDYSVTARAKLRASQCSDATGFVGLIVRCSGGVNDYAVEVRVKTSSIEVYDLNGSTSKATKAVSNVATNLHLLVSVNDSGGVSVWYIDGDFTDDQEWLEAYSSTSGLTSAAGTSSYVRFGNLYTVTSSATASQWMMVSWNSDQNVGSAGSLADGVALADVFGVAATQSPVYVAGGLRVSSEGGPAYFGERWSIPATYSYPIDHIFPQVNASPADGWRSTSDGVNNIAIDLVGTTTNTWLMSPMVGLYLKGINFRTATLQGYLQGTGWQNLVSIDTATDFTAIPYTRRGNAIYPSTTHSPARTLRHGELAGCRIDLGSGEIRTVLTNTGGMWSAGSNVRPTIVLGDDFDGTEPNSGTANVWYDEVLAVASIGANYYRGYRIAVQNQTTIEGHHMIGQSVVGPFFPFGTDCSYGYVRSQRANVAISETASRRKRAKKLGETLREAAISWTDGIDERLWQLMADDTILGVASGVAAAVPGDTASLLEGLHAALDGSYLPLVYVTGLDYNDAPWHVTERSRVIYGRMVGDLEVSNVIGDEHEQVVQVQTIVIEEEA